MGEFSYWHILGALITFGLGWLAGWQAHDRAVKTWLKNMDHKYIAIKREKWEQIQAALSLSKAALSSRLAGLEQYERYVKGGQDERELN